MATEDDRLAQDAKEIFHELSGGKMAIPAQKFKVRGLCGLRQMSRWISAGL